MEYIIELTKTITVSVEAVCVAVLSSVRGEAAKSLKAELKQHLKG